jgi:hypothetical protein
MSKKLTHHSGRCVVNTLFENTSLHRVRNKDETTHRCNDSPGIRQQTSVLMHLVSEHGINRGRADCIKQAAHLFNEALQTLRLGTVDIAH